MSKYEGLTFFAKMSPEEIKAFNLWLYDNLRYEWCYPEIRKDEEADLFHTGKCNLWTLSPERHTTPRSLEDLEVGDYGLDIASYYENSRWGG